MGRGPSTLVIVLALAACKHHAGTDQAASNELDWDRCAAALAHPELGTEAVLDGCKVCGDWRPVLMWKTPQAEGGPTKMAIANAMDRCNAWCEPTAKTKFLSPLDDARGTDKRVPWKQLADMCKAAVSAGTDSRYASAPYFALDRIARAAAAHGGPAAAALDKLVLPLPAASVSGWGVDLPELKAPTRPAPRIHITLLGTQLYVGMLPRAHLGKDGVAVDYGGTPYPGKLTAPSDLAAAIAALVTTAPSDPPGALPEVTVLAPRGMAAASLQPVVDALRGKAVLDLAVGTEPLPDWTIPYVLAHPIQEVGGAATIQDLAAALAR
jgi:hypothetical protein